MQVDRLRRITHRQLGIAKPQCIAEVPRSGRCRDLTAELLVSPVSYTHLRAHETVLDLVCRLLLEKKKN